MKIVDADKWIQKYEEERKKKLISRTPIHKIKHIMEEIPRPGDGKEESNMKMCYTCEKFNRRRLRCSVLTETINDCWAYTNDPLWKRKVIKDIKEYQRYKNKEIGPYWRDNIENQ